MKKLKYLAHLTLIYSAATMIGACSQVKFETLPPPCTQNNTCKVGPNGTTYEYTVNTNSLPLDVLLVVDNSGSMTRNQQDLASRFGSFMSLVQSFDYHVAVVTTNVVDSVFTQTSGARLVTFGDGSKFLTPHSSNPEGLLQANIVRPETVTCDQYLQAKNDCMGTDCSDYPKYCPSPDSRAIYAADLVVQRTDTDARWGNFLRSDAPLHVILISNSDERVCATNPNCPYRLETVDQPNTLIQAVKSRFGGAKPLTVHSIIIAPNDAGCLSQQYWSPTLFGQYAPLYQEVAQETGGVVGTICASDYSSQLQQIGQVSQNQLLSQIRLKCKTSNNNLIFTLNPQPPTPITGQLDSTGQVLVFSSPLPPNTAVSLRYTCN